MRPTVLVAPGLGDSGPDHWQTLWQKRHGYLRVRQTDWNAPDPDAWIRTLDEQVKATGGRVVIAAHSLGCVMVAHFARRFPSSKVAGALLVAPADVDSPLHTPDEVRGFAPLPMVSLPFPSVVVASRTDPYVRFARAQDIARAWGARFVDAGRVGHINADSGHGDWEEGHALLEEVIALAGVGA